MREYTKFLRIYLHAFSEIHANASVIGTANEKFQMGYAVSADGTRSAHSNNVCWATAPHKYTPSVILLIKLLRGWASFFPADAGGFCAT